MIKSPIAAETLQDRLAVHHDCLLSVQDAADYLHLSIPTVYRLLRSGRLKGAKLGGRWRTSHAAIREHLKDMISVRIPP